MVVRFNVLDSKGAFYRAFSLYLIKSINNPETRIMCIYIISYDHLKKRMYKLAENELKNLLLDIKLYEDKISNNNDDSDSKLKESISRCKIIFK